MCWLQLPKPFSSQQPPVNRLTSAAEHEESANQNDRGLRVKEITHRFRHSAREPRQSRDARHALHRQRQLGNELRQPRDALRPGAVSTADVSTRSRHFVSPGAGVTRPRADVSRGACRGADVSGRRGASPGRGPGGRSRLPEGRPDGAVECGAGAKQVLGEVDVGGVFRLG